MIPRADRYPLVLELMGGLGDNIYARPFVRAWCAAEGDRPVWLFTPWPQLFSDIPNARFIRPHRMNLRTQLRNMNRTNARLWSSPGPRADRRRFHYRLEVPGESILAEIERGVGLPAGQPFVFDLPDFGPSPVPGDRIAVVRPVTIRREWSNTARNPDAAYVARAAEMLREAGYTVVVAGDIDAKTEPALLPLPVGDVNYIRGELSAVQVLALMQHASVVVGGVGFIVPAALALRVPAIFIAGGQAAHNGPAVVIDRRVDASLVRWVIPDEYCGCRSMRHECPKHITDFDGQFTDALDALVEVAV